MHKSIGIVIQNCAPAKQKIMLFDKQTGTYWATTIKRQLSPGSLICYEKKVGPSITFLSSIELLDIPFFWAQEDILFLHHILELCSLFVPIGQPQPELFMLLEFLYINEQKHSLSKKVFLCKFFIILGFYPEGDSKQLSFVFELAKLSIDSACKQVIDLNKQMQLEQWLERCMQYYASHKQMKTTHFLKVSKSI